MQKTAKQSIMVTKLFCMCYNPFTYLWLVHLFDCLVFSSSDDNLFIVFSLKDTILHDEINNILEHIPQHPEEAFDCK